MNNEETIIAQPNGKQQSAQTKEKTLIPQVYSMIL